jgi:putative FmdB family regulatory protein
MPIFRFQCVACGNEKNFSVAVQQIKTFQAECPVCKQQMQRKLGTPDVLEKEQTDEYRGRSRFANTDKKRKDRTDEHFRKVELPRIIESQGTAFAERMGWLDPNKKPR